MLRVFHRGRDIWSLNSQDDRRTQRLACAGKRFRSFQSLGFRERIPLARKLRPHESMNAAPVYELQFLNKRVHVQLVGLGERRLSNGEDSPEPFVVWTFSRCAKGVSRGKSQADARGRYSPQDVAPARSLQLLRKFHVGTPSSER